VCHLYHFSLFSDFVPVFAITVYLCSIFCFVFFRVFIVLLFLFVSANVAKFLVSLWL